MTTFDELLDQLKKPSSASIPKLQVPVLNLPLLPYQEEAVGFALQRGETYLALDMGLGKTACAIAIAVAEVGAGNAPVGVCVPPSLRINWEREFLKFAPHIRVKTIKGNKPYDVSGADVIVFGDSVLSSWACADPQKRSPYDLHGKIKALIVDEAHRHKNNSSRAKSLSSLAKTVRGRRVLLSGTPIPNGRTVEIVNQLNVLGDNAWAAIGGMGKFWQYYAPKQSYGRGSVDLEGLGDVMRSTFMLRKRRDEVLDLPNKGRSAIILEGHGDGIRKYIEIENDLIAFLQKEGREWRGAARNETLVKLNLMRAAAGESKVRALIEHITDMMDTPGGVFVVAEHNLVMDNLVMGLYKHGVVCIRGGMSDNDKAEAMDAFNTGRARILVGQITSAGTGFTLHGNGLNHRVVIAQIPWTPAELRQAEDRLHRIGQTHDVTVEVALCHIENKLTIDERLWSVLESKAFDTGRLIDGMGEYLLSEVQESIIDSYR
jgi:SWI/SNF-related matrix-associated actin-dependent regulator 1 of chromatin subfamily A